MLIEGMARLPLPTKTPPHLNYSSYFSFFLDRSRFMRQQTSRTDGSVQNI